MAREIQLKENGYDLMKMSVHFPTCEVCAPLQGRVYSISGKDKRFPPIERVYRNGYRNVHPNCRHVMTPFIEELQTDDEMQAEIAESNKPFDDPRPEVEKKLYNKEQQKNRRIRQDRYQYERYKARLGEDAPKSFSAFRRMKNSNSFCWQALNDQYNLKSLSVHGKIQKTMRSSNTVLGEQLAFSDGLKRAFIPKSAEIKDVQIIAAPELSRPFRMAEERSKQFGGDSGKWVKKVGAVESDRYIFDVHWEENIDVGRKNWKIKNYKEKVKP